MQLIKPALEQVGHCIILRFFLPFLLFHVIYYVILSGSVGGFAPVEVGKLFPVAANAGEDALFSLAAQFQLFVAFGAACVCGLRQSLAVAALPVLTNEHFALFAVDLKQILSADGAFFLCCVYCALLAITIETSFVE